MEATAISNISKTDFNKEDIMSILKIIIPAGTILLVAFGAYKNNYIAYGNCFGFEFHLSPLNGAAQ